MNELRAVLAVGAGAALGGMLRYLIGGFVVGRFGGNQAWLATAFINISGAFLIGVVIELATRGGVISPLARVFLATGILGGYTTFSTYAWEVLSLAGEQSRLLATAYGLGSLVLGVAAAYGGSVLARLAVR